MPIGKRVADHLYIHVSALGHVSDEAARTLIGDSLGLLPAEDAAQVNVIKLHETTRAVSLLHYADFDSDPFPRLVRGWIRNRPNDLAVSKRIYENSSNPPILHRKELLVADDYPERPHWVELTESGEALGLFDDTTTIGFLMNWERLIASKGLQLLEGRFLPLGNDVGGGANTDAEPVLSGIQRHRTALARVALSTPVQLLARHDLLQNGSSFFDYGCGRGGDMERLAASGFSVAGWDPHYAPDSEIKAADVVNLGFVINVIEDPAERLEALKSAFALCRKVLSIGVMLSGNHTERQVTYGDGVLSGRNTFQKYFTQFEFKSYLETVLEKEVHLVGPGIAFVFADPEVEFRFLSRRFRARNVASRLIASTRRPPKPRPEPRVRVPIPRGPPPLSASAIAVLDRLWQQALDLGRTPEEDEVIDAERLRVEFPSYRKAVKELARDRHMALLDRAAQTRKDDLDLYFAMQHFTKRADRKNPDPALQRDIRHFYGSFAAASDAGLHLLRTAADPSKIYESCVWASEQGLGWLEDQTSLQHEAMAVKRLPAVLRAYVACGIQICGAISDFQLVKVHIGSGKLSLLDYAEYNSPLPRLRRRVKVNLRKQDLQVFEYGSSEFPMPPLHWKSRFMSEDADGYAEQVAFDEQIEALGLIAIDRNHEDVLRALSARRFEIGGNSLRRCTSIPELDERCGRFFRFRDLIECGETQQRLGISNKPLRAESYNALHDLAVRVLDPVIDYFGAIRLTYGLCSAALAKHIKRRVAPKLDQHAAAECNSKGAPICERGGAACDFVVEDENMTEVADWIIANTPFDRLYFYGPTMPLHVSYGPNHSRQAFWLREDGRGKLAPSKYVPARGCGARQGSCRLNHAASCLRVWPTCALMTQSRSGLRVTASTGDQLRVAPDHRAGLRSRARV